MPIIIIVVQTAKRFNLKYCTGIFNCENKEQRKKNTL